MYRPTASPTYTPYTTPPKKSPSRPKRRSSNSRSDSIDHAFVIPDSDPGTDLDGNYEASDAGVHTEDEDGTGAMDDVIDTGSISEELRIHYEKRFGEFGGVMD